MCSFDVNEQLNIHYRLETVKIHNFVPDGTKFFKRLRIAVDTFVSTYKNKNKNISLNITSILN